MSEFIKYSNEMYENDYVSQAKVNCMLKTIAGRVSVECTLVFKQKLENYRTNLLEVSYLRVLRKFAD